ncbi:MAG: Os1348 family NHLP clan protein [Dehalococcoidales bacterium]
MKMDTQNIMELAQEKQLKEVTNMVPVTTKQKQNAVDKAQGERRERILAVLSKAADDSRFLARLADNPEKALKDYYTLTPEEVAALASGDIKTIENWLGKLDQRHATWLWCRLSQEKW